MTVRFKQGGIWHTAKSLYYKKDGKWIGAMSPPKPKTRKWTMADFNKIGEDHIRYKIKPELRQYWIVGDTLQLRIYGWAGDHPEEYIPIIPGITGEFDWMSGIDISGTIEAGAVGLEVWDIHIPDNGDYAYFRTADDKKIPIKKA